MPRPSPLPCGRRSPFRHRADGNVAAVSHGLHVLMPTAAAAWGANTAVSKAAWWPWPLTFWPWKWCPLFAYSSHNFYGAAICIKAVYSQTVVKVVMWSRGLTWRSQVAANPIPILHPTNLALFGHKITLYRFNQGGSYYCRGRGLKSEQGSWAPWPHHFNHCSQNAHCKAFLGRKFLSSKMLIVFNFVLQKVGKP